jgi:uncharacterized protein (TIGR02058 family)
MNRYVIEFGMGVDLHGQDLNEAAERAIFNATHSSCLSGLDEVLHLDNVDEQVVVNVTIAAPRPDEIDKERLKAGIHIGKCNIETVEGGMHKSGFFAPQFGDSDDSTEVVVAAVEVCIK